MSARVSVGAVVYRGADRGRVAAIDPLDPDYVVAHFDDGSSAFAHVDTLIIRGDQTHARGSFAAYLAHENAWTRARADVVVRQMLADAGRPLDSLLTEVEWLHLSQAYFASAPQPMTEPLVGSWS